MSQPPSTNPYASPSVPAAPPTIDFREAAVEESLRLIEAAPGRDPDELGRSLVLPADADGFGRLRWIGRMMLVRLVAGAEFPGWSYFLSSFTAVMLWPALNLLLLLPQYQPVDHDDNRPI